MLASIATEPRRDLAPRASLRAILGARRRLREAEREDESTGGFHGRVRRAQRKASAEIDRALADLDEVIVAAAVAGDEDGEGI